MPTPEEPDVPVAMVRAAFALREVIESRFRRVKPEITPVEFGLLHLLALEDGQRVGTLADAVVRDRTTITRLADRLVAKKLVVRREDPEDRRAVRHWLTATGRKLHARLLPCGRRSWIWPSPGFRRAARRN